MTRLQWTKSSEGYTSTKCGRYDIEPVFMGRTTPQAFNVLFRPPFTDKRELLKRYSDTQRDAKLVAEDHCTQRLNASL